MITFKNLPDTTTPINAENLNENFSEYEIRRVYDTVAGDRGWFKILHIPSTAGWGFKQIVFLITSGGSNTSFDEYIIAKIQYYNDVTIVANILDGNYNSNYLGYIKNTDNSIDIYLYNDTVYKMWFIKPISKYGDWDIWNNNYPIKVNEAPNLTKYFDAKSYLQAKLKSITNITSSQTSLNLVENQKKGNTFSIENGKIKVLKPCKAKINYTCNVYGNVSAEGMVYCYIFKNNTEIIDIQDNFNNTTDRCTLNCTVIVDFDQNDVLDFKMAVGSGTALVYESYYRTVILLEEVY